MNLPRRCSGAKALAAQQSKEREHLQTLPCEDLERPLEEEWKKHTSSMSLDFPDGRDPIRFPTSPTFPNDLSSLNSYKDKENRSSLVNRQPDRNIERHSSKDHHDLRSHSPNPQSLHESRLLRGANQRLTERNNELEDENKRLKGMLHEAERLLAIRIEESELNFFSVSNSSSDRSSIDLFLQLLHLKQNLKDLERNAYQKGQQFAKAKIEEAAIVQKQKEDEFARHAKQFTATFDKLKAKNEELKQEVSRLEALNLQQEDKRHEQDLSRLKEAEAEWQRLKLQQMKRLKELEEQARQKQLKYNQLESQCAEVEREYESVSLENQKNKQTIRKMEKKVDQANKEKEKIDRLLQQQKDTVNQLRDEITSLQTNKAKLSKELMRVSSQLKSVRHESDLQKQMQTEREISELDGLRNQIEQLRHRVDREKAERDRFQSRCQSTQQEYSRLQAQFNEVIKESEIIRADTDRLEKEQIELRQQNNELKRKLTDNESELRNLRKSEYYSNESQYKSENRVSSKIKEMLRTLKDSLPKYDSLRARKSLLSTSADEELEVCVNEASVLLGSLVLLEQKSSKENQLLRQKLQSYDRDRELYEQDKAFEVGLKQEAIRKLIQFAPQDCMSLISEYLFTIEEMISRCTNEHLQEKTELLGQISQQAYNWKEKVRQLEETERKYCQLRSEHEQLRRMFTVNESKRGELSMEVYKRDVKKKYFE